MNKILIAEDEAPIANLIRTALEGAGYRCAWAPDGADAADKLEAQPFDLALLDIMLPKADGYEVLEYCKSLEVPVIFLTAKGELEDRVKGLRLGAEDYIVKDGAGPLPAAGHRNRHRQPRRAPGRGPRGPDRQGVRFAAALPAKQKHRPLPGPNL